MNRRRLVGWLAGGAMLPVAALFAPVNAATALLRWSKPPRAVVYGDGGKPIYDPRGAEADRLARLEEFVADLNRNFETRAVAAVQKARSRDLGAF